MADYSQSAIYKLNKYLADRLRAAGIIPSESSYTTRLSTGQTMVLPIFSPTQQSPEQTTMYDTPSVEDEGFVDLPFANYTVAYRTERDQPYMTCGQITYMFYSHDIDKLAEIANFVIDLCKREDYSAADLNQYLGSDLTNVFQFHSLYVPTAGGPMESESEGGRNSFMIVISFDHTYDSQLIHDTVGNALSGGQGMWS